MTHWRTPHTDEEGRRFYELHDMREISRDVMFFICGLMVGCVIGLGMAMVVA